MREVFGALTLGFRMMELNEEVEGEDTLCSGDDSSPEDAFGGPVAFGWASAPAPPEIGTAASV